MKRFNIYKVKGHLLNLFVLLVLTVVCLPSWAKDEEEKQEKPKKYKWERVYMYPKRDLVRGAVEQSTHVDTFSLKERIALRTNGFDWIMLTPNIGIEVDILRTNWNRWAVTLDLKSNFSTSHNIKPSVLFKRTEVVIGAKDYFCINEASYFARHKWLRKIFSGWQLYRGAFIGYHDYGMMFTRDNGHMGTGISFGVNAGMMRQIHVFNNGNSIDFELGLGLGMMIAKDKKFVLNEENNTYDVVENGGFKPVPFPVPVDVRLGVVYRFGKKDPKTYIVTNNLNNRYYYRQDIDNAYLTALKDKKEQMARDLEEKKRNELFAKDSTELLGPVEASVAKAETMFKMPQFADTTSYQYIVLSEAVSNVNKDMATIKNDIRIGDKPEQHIAEREALIKELDMYMDIAAQHAGVQVPTDTKSSGKKSAASASRVSKAESDTISVVKNKKAAKTEKTAKTEKVAKTVKQKSEKKSKSKGKDSATVETKMPEAAATEETNVEKGGDQK